MESVVTMCFNNEEYVPFCVFADGSAKCNINNVIHKIGDFGAWFIDAMDRGWKKVAEYNLPSDVLVNNTTTHSGYKSRRDEFRSEWYDLEEESIENWGGQ